MSTLRVGINGMGRIGRTILREVYKRNLNKEFQIVALNNPGDASRYIHLLKYDSVHGPMRNQISFDSQKSQLTIDGDTLAFYTQKDPAQIPWEKSQVDIVIDATGVFKDKESLSLHKRGSVKKVIMCAPGQNLDGTFVMGINHDQYRPEEHHILSNASCTTNCLAPVAKVIHDHWGIESGFMTTVHSYTSDQNLLDGKHKDLRRARAAALSMIPTTTGAAKSLGVVIPELKGKLDGFAVRVPTPNVSMVDLTVNLREAVSIELVNQTMKQAAEGSLKGILQYCDEPLVSQDFQGNPYSSIFDSTMTNIIEKTLKVVAWYDNEVGFSNRVIDLATFVGKGK